LVKKD